MCGRYVVARTLSGALPDLLSGLEGWDPDFENYNIPPSTHVPVVVDEPSATTGEMSRRVTWAHWGFVPAWKADFDQRPQPINARLETAATNGMFRRAFRHGHCIFPASGYIEWQVRADGSKHPHYIRGAHESGLAMAGLFEDWSDHAHPDAAPRRTVTILTRAAVGPASDVHDRMPVLLGPDDYAPWLASQFGSAAETTTFLEKASDDVAIHLEMFEVDPRIGNVRHNGVDLITPLGAHDTRTSPSGAN